MAGESLIPEALPPPNIARESLILEALLPPMEGYPLVYYFLYMYIYIDIYIYIYIYAGLNRYPALRCGGKERRI